MKAPLRLGDHQITTLRGEVITFDFMGAMQALVFCGGTSMLSHA
jgi:hypothetical protein